MSEILLKTREYEKKYSAFIDREERPAFHLSPRVGWTTSRPSAWQWATA